MLYWAGYEIKGQKYKEAAEFVVSERLTRGAWWLIPLGHWTRLDYELMAPAWRGAASQKHKLDGTSWRGATACSKAQRASWLFCHRWHGTMSSARGVWIIPQRQPLGPVARVRPVARGNLLLWLCSAIWGWQMNHVSIHSHVCIIYIYVWRCRCVYIYRDV